MNIIESEFWDALKSGKFASMVKESSNGQSLSSPQEVFNVMKPLYSQADDVEVLYCLFLNSKNKILSVERMFTGSISGSAVYPREIIKKALLLKSVAVIMVHNHPSGDSEPSQEDQNITKKVMIALSSIDIVLHDHIIVGDTYFSLKEAGIFERIKESIHPLTCL